MEAVRQKVLGQPGTLPRLVLQLQQGDADAQTKAAEMLFCVVGQGPGRDKEATRQVSSDSHRSKGHLVTLQEVMFNFICKSFLDRLQSLGPVYRGAVAACLYVQIACYCCLYHLLTPVCDVLQALDNKLLEAILTVVKDTASQPASRVQKDQELQQLMALMVAMLAQITFEKEDEPVIQSAIAQGAIRVLRSVFDMLSGDGSQQNLVSMLWHWSSRGGDVRKQIMACGMAELQVSLLGLQHSPVQRQTAADQLAAYVAYPNQVQDDTQPRDVRLAEDLINVGAPMALIDMLSSNYHELVRCSAGQAIATLATVSPGDKMKIIAAGAIGAVVGMMQPSEPAAVRESGAVLLITLATGNPEEGPIFTQNEAAVQFAAMGAIPALADMLSPINGANTRVMALQAVSVLASALEERVQNALVSADILSVTLELLRVLAGRLEWDSSLDELKGPTVVGMRLKCAEILACLSVNNKDHIRLLVEAGAIPEMTVVASDTDIPEAEREVIMSMLHHMCQTDGDVLAILSAMMSD